MMRKGIVRAFGQTLLYAAGMALSLIPISIPVLVSMVVFILVPVAAGQTGKLKPATVLQTEGRSAKALAYDVVTIRPAGGDPNSGGIMDRPDGFSMKNLTLEPLIPSAYGMMRNDEVSGWPAWAAFTRFDIEAKMDVETADALQKLPKKEREAQRELMMQAVLADRFKLKVHRGTEVQPGYELVLAKGGSRLKEDEAKTATLAEMDVPDGMQPVTDWMTSEGRITGHAMPISILAGHLQGGAVDAIVVDKTGLTGRYDVVLKWDPKADQGGEATEPSIFTALKEQLGLELKPTKITVETIVIDHLEMPSQN